MKIPKQLQQLVRDVRGAAQEARTAAVECRQLIVEGREVIEQARQATAAAQAVAKTVQPSAGITTLDDTAAPLTDAVAAVTPVEQTTVGDTIDADTTRPAPNAGVTPTSQHQGSDWGNIGIGPNIRTGAGLPTRLGTPELAFRPRFEMDPIVAHRFNAYAAAAAPREIGGLLRIQIQSDGTHRATDIRIFPHVAASGGYFELDGTEVAKFNLELVRAGRAEEVAEWKSLVHSHPGFAPFLSGTDRENLKRLAGPTYAWSVICSAHVNTLQNYYAVHYAQSSPFSLVVVSLPVEVSEGTLIGTDLLDADDLALISDEVDDAFAHIQNAFGRYSNHWDWVKPHASDETAAVNHADL